MAHVIERPPLPIALPLPPTGNLLGPNYYGVSVHN
jgi:hypothetical protein